MRYSPIPLLRIGSEPPNRFFRNWAAYVCSAALEHRLKRLFIAGSASRRHNCAHGRSEPPDNTLAPLLAEQVQAAQRQV